jgi:hypothetical protein
VRYIERNQRAFLARLGPNWLHDINFADQADNLRPDSCLHVMEAVRWTVQRVGMALWLPPQKGNLPRESSIGVRESWAGGREGHGQRQRRRKANGDVSALLRFGWRRAMKLLFVLMRARRGRMLVNSVEKLEKQSILPHLRYRYMWTVLT